MKFLMGSELAGFIKERQVQSVRSLTQLTNITPKLAIIKTVDNPVIDLYVRLKEGYAKDIGAKVEVYRIKQNEVPDLLARLNSDNSVHGIIIQLPLEDPKQTEELVNQVAPEKDVDALGEKAQFDPATPVAILWLLSGFNIDLVGKHVVLIGRGKLVGGPLEKMLRASGIDVTVIDSNTKNVAAVAREADVIVTATGRPAILTSDMVKSGAVVVDAGVASEEGKTLGDVAKDVLEREDITITPEKGGVGPLTICALFENLIQAAERSNTHE
ncbi:bifunctional 5,10-methylenetetrahydrofolate dehydrogenase/5,10-methenyltetrahydrofolate cyclohydrolase [Patescibacteria group bacterium]|nr:bifunctional 5,10-methylenetetrahydrofolate dehydrogenase/5,10-methenyltetrahydrofolate cyclohydrolase [Patescibacteria group bacterium]